MCERGSLLGEEDSKKVELQTFSSFFATQAACGSLAAKRRAMKSAATVSTTPMSRHTIAFCTKPAMM